MPEAYIYALIDPRMNEVRYIGKTSDLARRLRRHITEIGPTPRHAWLAELREAERCPCLLSLGQVDPRRWGDAERHWIALFREAGFPLVNLCSGGNGAPGKALSEETRQKISASVAETWKEKPRRLSPEHKAKLLSAHAAYTYTPEVRERIGAAHRGRKQSPEVTAHMAASKRGKSHAPIGAAGRAKIAEALSGEGNGMAKLDWAKVDAIRAAYAEGATCGDLARRCAVDYKTIYRVVRNEQWVRRPDNLG